ncbi:HNH endonuclease, partial [Candidatus Poribacteria bacterium]|nr:HNH endonuclease [Candidatus Poribacteria bacterium]
LQLVLKNKGEIESKEDWTKQVLTTPIYQHTRVVTRFLIFCASDNTVPDNRKKGLLKRGRVGIDPLLTYNKWKDKAYFTVEHVAPKSNNGDWKEDIYTDSKIINTLGNLILLPKKENEILGNRRWEHKRLMYCLLSSKTEDEFNSLLTQSGSVGLTISKRANEVINNAKYLSLCKSIALYDKDWSLCIIEKRTRCLAELAWDRIEKWLFSDS